ncbi:MAG: recombination mediator RecR [Candidatus Pacebacteria bacterium]|nr:recombination mediator RecR [Candidatus Paceibacterota bacterium]
MIPKAIQKLIEIFSDFPTIGKRTALRFVFYLLDLPEDKLREISFSILNLKKEIKRCSLCFNVFTPPINNPKESKCEICNNPKRNKDVLLIVEKESDLWQIEKTKSFDGLYFVLGGTINFSQKQNKKTLRIEELKKRIKEIPVKEIILGFDWTTDGEITMQWLQNMLKKYNTKITRLAQGVPTGGEIEYLDDKTIKEALKWRK